MAATHIHYDFNIKVDEKALQHKVEELLDDKTKIAINTLLAKTINPWVPFLEGALSQTLKITPDKISYLVPYARRQYFGDSFNFTKDFHPLACARWLDVAMQTQHDVFTKQASAIVERRAKELNG